MVDHAFEDNDARAIDTRTCAIKQLAHVWKNRSCHGRQGAAVHMESRNAFQDRSISYKDRSTLPFNDGKRVGHTFQPPVLNENRSCLHAGIQCAGNDLGTLGDEDALGWLDAAPQLHVGKTAVVG